MYSGHCKKTCNYRWQLGEVDHFLESAPGVQQSVTICATVGGDDMLIAFLTPATVDTRAAKDALSALVPAHMLPRSLFAVNSLPATASGKPDKKALLALFTDISTLAGDDEEMTYHSGPEEGGGGHQEKGEKKRCAWLFALTWLGWASLAALQLYAVFTWSLYIKAGMVPFCYPALARCAGAGAVAGFAAAARLARATTRATMAAAGAPPPPAAPRPRARACALALLLSASGLCAFIGVAYGVTTCRVDVARAERAAAAAAPAAAKRASVRLVMADDLRVRQLHLFVSGMPNPHVPCHL